MASHDILLVDDEADILEFLKYNLEKEGFTVMTANNGEDALKKFDQGEFKLIILDVMMPEMDGIETCEQIRSKENGGNVIIMFLTARGEDYSQIAGFEAGADDYITKPVKPKVFVSKIKALMRRNEIKEDQPKKADKEVFVVDQDQYLIYKNGKEIALPKKEFEMASLLISKPGHVYTREKILNMIWGEEVVVGDRTIDVHMRKIREKLGKKYFKTIQGVGYKYTDK